MKVTLEQITTSAIRLAESLVTARLSPDSYDRLWRLARRISLATGRTYLEVWDHLLDEARMNTAEPTDDNARACR